MPSGEQAIVEQEIGVHHTGSDGCMHGRQGRPGRVPSGERGQRSRVQGLRGRPSGDLRLRLCGRMFRLRMYSFSLVTPPCTVTSSVERVHQDSGACTCWKPGPSDEACVPQKCHLEDAALTRPQELLLPKG